MIATCVPARQSFLFLGLCLLSFVPARCAEFPQAQISNSKIKAKLYLPDRDLGYYRGGRFDWSGVISQLEYAGHNYFGVWFPRYDPELHDAITGPVDEFRSADGALGYAEAPPGDLFVKIGVGVLRKPDNEPYQFARHYQIIGTGQWILRPHPDYFEFVQEVHGVRGYSYLYSKTVRLSGNKPELILEHKLKNIGKRAIETEVYNHDFYVIDNQPTGPDFNVIFPFSITATDSLKGAAETIGNELHYKRELHPGRDSVASYITGYGSNAKGNDIRVENRKVGAGVEEIGSLPLSKLYFWSIRTTLCPEAYVSLKILPGKTAKWHIAYRFYTLTKQ